MKLSTPASMIVRFSPVFLRSLIVAFVLALVSAIPTASLAGPGVPTSGSGAALSQNVDYISVDRGAALDLGFPVLVPGWVPAPFGGSPAIDAGGGYYSLYWINGGGAPTFLQVTGQVGGGLPAGSPYDLNVELVINASVQGYSAIHDVSPAYDAVWWVAGGVLYKVESRNSGTDSLTLANSLIVFVPPAPPEPTSPPPPPPPPTSPPAVPTAPPQLPPTDPGNDTGGSATLPESPTGETSQSTSNQDAGTSPSVAQDSNASESPAANASESPDDDLVPLGTDGTGDPSVDSDGTGGADAPVMGGDGTGGTTALMIPLPADPQTP